MLAEYDNIFDVLMICYDDIISKRIDVMSNWETRREIFIEMVGEFMELFQNKRHNEIFIGESKLMVIQQINKMKERDTKLYKFALIIAINNAFGSYDYRYNLREDIDLSIMDQCIESDGEEIVEQTVLNTSKTIHLGKVFFKMDSIFNKFFSECNYPTGENECGNSIEYFIDKLLIIRNVETEVKTQYYNLTCEYTQDRIEETSDSLKIALVPFIGDEEYLNVKPDGTKFTVNIEDKQENFDHITKIMDELNKNNVNIAVFPEMTFTTRMEEVLEKYLLENDTSFIFVVSGSTWENRTNKCKMYNGKGRVLVEQLKINPYSIEKDPERKKKGNTEGLSLKSEQAIINVLDIKDFGRLATPICLDFAKNNYFEPLLKGGVNISLNPVCTGSLHKFGINANRLGDENKGVVFISNSCIKRKNEKIGFVYLPIKIDQKIKALTEDELVYKREDSCRECIEGCIKKTCFKLFEFSYGYCRTKTVRL
jgi:hypothetical protein